MTTKIALLGVGPMAALHAGVIAHVPGLELVSVASRDLAKAEDFAGRHGIARARRTPDLLERPEADALWVVGPCDAMAALADAAAGTGLPLFLEKPVGLSAAETRAVAARVAVPTMVGLNRRFYEVVQRARDVVAAAGGLRAMEIHMPEDMGRVPADRHAEVTLRQWQFANSVHLLDLFRFLGGEPARVQTANVVRGVGDRSYNALVAFESGAVGHYNGQWYAPGGWRVALYADGVMVELKPIEQATVFRRGAAAETIGPSGPDATFKAGLFGQAAAFGRLVAGSPHPYAADLGEYARSVELVDALTACG